MKIESLTSLRFFAALMVVVSHLNFLKDSQSGLLRHLYNALFYEGYIGVTFFFILSGFILSHSYGDRLDPDIRYNKPFFIARIARIYPLHFLTFLISLPLVFYSFIKTGPDYLSLLPNVLLIQSFFADSSIYFSANSPSWSLSNEMFFYLLFPILLFRRNITLLCIGSLILAFQCYITFSSLPDAEKQFWIYIFPPSRLVDFIVGIAAYRAFKYLKATNTQINANLLQGFSIVTLCLFFIIKEHCNQSFRYDMYYIIPMALVVFSFAFMDGHLAKILGHKIPVLLGEASFSLYLFHQLVKRYVTGINTRLLGFEGIACDYMLSFIIVISSVAISVFVYKFYEIRAKDFTQKLLFKLF